MQTRTGNIAFLVLAVAFLAIGLSGQRAFFILSIPFLVLYLAGALRSRR